MSPDTEDIIAGFVCPKCRNHRCTAEDVSVPSGRLARMIPILNQGFIALSCSLCGYTEFYNRAIVVEAEEEESVRKSNLADNPENP